MEPVLLLLHTPPGTTSQLIYLAQFGLDAPKNDATGAFQEISNISHNTQFAQASFFHNNSFNSALCM
jgi:hypothetical protein